MIWTACVKNNSWVDLSCPTFHVTHRPVCAILPTLVSANRVCGFSHSHRHRDWTVQRPIHGNLQRPYCDCESKYKRVPNANRMDFLLKMKDVWESNWNVPNIASSIWRSLDILVQNYSTIKKQSIKHGNQVNV